MDRYLVVANQTLGGEELVRTIRERIERGDSHFHVVVPMTAPEHEAEMWTGGFSVGAPEGLPPGAARRQLEAEARQREAALGEARRRSARRLEQMIEKIRSAGAEAEGSVGDPDPAVAAKEALRDRSFDEVIVSTLPIGISRWLKMDLPSRISRLTDAPVTTVEADS